MNSPNNKNEGLARNSNPIDRERQPSHSPENASSLAKINQALKFIFVSVCVTTLGSIVFSIQAKTIAEYFSIFGVALLIQVSSLLAGMLTGFLFGIPRSLQTDSPPIVTENNGTSKQLSQPGFRGNTNLEQISDWLTKILVGVGLTQIGSISSALGSFGNNASKSLGGFPGSSSAFAIAIALASAFAGFLIGFLWTRMFLGSAMREADMVAMFGLLDKAERKIDDVETQLVDMVEQYQYDAEAMQMIQRQLNATPDNPAPPEADLMRAMSLASQAVRDQAFSLAQKQRYDNWNSHKPKMELTIPVFRALIACEGERPFHRNHGQLGFALKDQQNPDWEGALKELSKAIDTAENHNEITWPYYRINRAICLINLDNSFHNLERSSADLQSLIISDIKGSASRVTPRFFKEGDFLARWMELNGVSVNDIGLASN